MCVVRLLSSIREVQQSVNPVKTCEQICLINVEPNGTFTFPHHVRVILNRSTDQCVHQVPYNV